jgi:hypothetical protein
VRTAWIGRTRRLLLVVVALLAALDLVTFVALVARPDARGPDQVARAVVQAVADDDCSDIGDLLGGSDLPPVLVSCLAGAPGPVEISAVKVADTVTDGDDSEVRVSVEVDGAPAEVVVVLRRTDSDWLVTTIRTQV